MIVGRGLGGGGKATTASLACILWILLLLYDSWQGVGWGWWRHHSSVPETDQHVHLAKNFCVSIWVMFAAPVPCRPRDPPWPSQTGKPRKASAGTRNSTLWRCQPPAPNSTAQTSQKAPSQRHPQCRPPWPCLLATCFLSQWGWGYRRRWAGDPHHRPTSPPLCWVRNSWVPTQGRGSTRLSTARSAAPRGKPWSSNCRQGRIYRRVRWLMRQGCPCRCGFVTAWPPPPPHPISCRTKAVRTKACWWRSWAAFSWHCRSHHSLAGGN